MIDASITVSTEIQRVTGSIGIKSKFFTFGILIRSQGNFKVALFKWTILIKIINFDNINYIFLISRYVT